MYVRESPLTFGPKFVSLQPLTSPTICHSVLSRKAAAPPPPMHAPREKVPKYFSVLAVAKEFKRRDSCGVEFSVNRAAFTGRR